jgi:hypothetical protein
MNRKAKLLSLLCLVAAPAAAPAAIVVSNLGEPPGSSLGVEFAGFVAQRFVTDGSASGFALDSVTLDANGSTSSVGNFFVAIFSNSGSGTPLASLGTLSGNSDPFAAGQYAYNAFAGGTLSPNTSYWVVLGVAPAPGTYAFDATSSDSSAGSWTIPGTASFCTSGNQGGTWFGPFDDFSLQMSIEATPVPEVEGWGLMTAGLASLGILWRQRRAT